MRPVSEATSRIAGQSFSKKYIALGRIVSHWDDIVGRDLASKAQPAKLRYHKHKNAKKSPEATLDIATTGAYATALHYQKDLILERINQIFGNKWITAIRFVTIAANSKAAQFKRPPPPISRQDQEQLHEMLGALEDEEIKLRLEKLGEAVIRESTSD